MLWYNGSFISLTTYNENLQYYIILYYIYETVIGQTMRLGEYCNSGLLHYQVAWYMYILSFKLYLTINVTINQPQTIGILTKAFCISRLNLVILAWTG